MTHFDKTKDVASSFDQLIGNTPALLMKKLNNTKANIIMKLEGENVMRSVKDRLALSVLNNAEREGKITRGESIIVEATSGNTGVALAHLGAIRGYKVIIAMPESMSLERRCLLRILGAELILTPATLGMKGAVAMAEKICSENPKAFLADQFRTKYNALVHEETTGPEIWEQCHQKVDYFVGGVGTGGTVTGIGRYLKRQNPSVKIIAVEPAESPVLSGGKPGPHKIQGIGAGFVPEVVDRNVIDEVVPVSGDDAVETSQRLARIEGVFCGFSSGAAVHAALRIAERPEMEGKNVVVLLPSFGERYLSTALFKSVRDEVSALPVVDASEIALWIHSNSKSTLEDIIADKYN